MAEQNSNQRNRMTPWFSSSLKFVGWMGTGVVSMFTVAEVMGRLVDITPRITRGGTLTILLLWFTAEAMLPFLRPSLAPGTRMVGVGWQARAYVVGVLLFLWLPSMVSRFYIQRVEIILDATDRMTTELGDSGITKFQAAKQGALEALDYLDPGNTAVALRLLYSDSSGQCKAAPDSAALIGFTQDYDLLRETLAGLRPQPADQAPFVESLELAVEDYIDARMLDQKFHILTFVGGDDTCGRSVDLFVRSLDEDRIVTNLFLILLLGREEEPPWSRLPNASLAFAREIEDVQTFVDQASQEIAPPAQRATSVAQPAFGTIPSSVPALSPAINVTRQEAETLEPEQPDHAEEGQPVTESDGPGAAPTQTRTRRPVFVPSPTGTPTLTFTPTRTLTHVPPATLTASHTSTATETRSPTPSLTFTPTLTLTPTLTQSPCPSPRTVLAGAAAYPGMVTVDTLLTCTTGLDAETAIPVAGRYFNMPAGARLWVLVYPWLQGVYYPQTPNACATPAPPPFQQDTNWNVDVYLGQKQQPPEWFDVVVVVADQAANTFISNWVHEGCPDHYSGIPPWQLEELNITEKYSVSVQTRLTP